MRFPTSDTIARIRTPLSTVVLAVLMVVLLAATPPARSCDLAIAWVAAHRDVLPVTRAEIQTYAAPWRRAIFAELPAEVRARLAHEHLQDLRNSTLTPQQSAMVGDVDAAIERMSRLELGEADSEIVQRWMPRIAQVFPGEPRAQTGRLFYQVFGDAQGDGLRPVLVHASIIPSLVSLEVHSFARATVPSVYSRMVECNCRPFVTNCGHLSCSTQGTCTIPDCKTPPCNDGQCY